MFDFIGYRKIWYLLSLLIILPGLFFLVTRGLNLGIDFAGGNLIQVKLEQPVETAEMRAFVAGQGLDGSSIRQAEGNRFILRTPEMTEEENEAFLNKLAEEFPGAVVERNEKVSPVIGRELTNNAIYALLIASALIVVYISIRFQFWFGIAAIIALLHDVFVTLGLFSIFQIEVDSAFVAAILTIIGYSINDTIVIFDRIRENRTIHKKENPVSVLNLSLRQTLFRSVMTSLTVVAALLALLFFGGQTTRVFALALLIGTISGTYSSIFTATPLWYDLNRWVNKGKERF